MYIPTGSPSLRSCSIGIGTSQTNMFSISRFRLRSCTHVDGEHLNEREAISLAVCSNARMKCLFQLR